MNFFRQYIIYSNAQLELKKGMAPPETRKICWSLSPKVRYRVVWRPSFSESRHQHQEPDEIKWIGRFRKIESTIFFKRLQLFAKLSTHHPGPGWVVPALNTEARRQEDAVPRTRPPPEVKWRKSATIGDRVPRGTEWTATARVETCSRRRSAELESLVSQSLGF